MAVWCMATARSYRLNASTSRRAGLGAVGLSVTERFQGVVLVGLIDPVLPSWPIHARTHAFDDAIGSGDTFPAVLWERWTLAEGSSRYSVSSLTGCFRLASPSPRSGGGWVGALLICHNWAQRYCNLLCDSWFGLMAPLDIP